MLTTIGRLRPLSLLFYALASYLLSTSAMAVTTAVLPSWVCAHPDTIFVGVFDTVAAIPHDPSNGAGGAHPGSFSRTISVSGYASEPYYLHVPASYTPAHAMPLLVVLHGAAGDHPTALLAAQDLRDDWAALSDSNGFIVIAPVGEASQGGWNAADPGNPGVPSDYDLIAAAFSDATAAYNIERSRRYLWGFSAGGEVAPDLVLNTFNSVINGSVIAAYSINSANIDFACSAVAGGCNALLNAQSRRIPIDIHIGSQDDSQLLASVQADHSGFLAHGWADGSTIFYTQFNDGHTYTGQLPGAWQSLCGFALTP